jgi:hypothetical protein
MTQTLKQQKNGRIRSLLLLPLSLDDLCCARSAQSLDPWCRTDALARVCPATAPSTDDVGPDNALQPGLLSASWAVPNNPQWVGDCPLLPSCSVSSCLCWLACPALLIAGVAPAAAGVSAQASNPSPTARGHGPPPNRRTGHHQTRKKNLPWKARESNQSKRVE